MKPFPVTLFLKEASVNTTEQFIPDSKVERVTPNPLGVSGGVSVISRILLVVFKLTYCIA